MILMLAPGPFISFGVCPSGLRYTSDQNGLVYVANNSAADQTALQDLGCSTLSPFGGWGTSFASLADLYAADASVTYNGVTGFPQYTAATVFDDATAGNNGTWAKTGIGTGAGSWTQVSTQTLATLASQIAAIDTEIAALQTSLAMAGTSVFASVAAAQASGSLANGAYFYVPSATSGGALDFYLKNSSTSSTFIATIPALGNGLLPIFTPQMYANAANVPNTGGDSSAAINAAITAANTAGGGIVLLSAGVWNISGITMKSGVQLIGSGAAVTTLRSYGTPAKAMITANTIANFSIRELTIDGQSDAVSYNLIALTQPTFFLLNRCHIINAFTGLYAVQFGNSTTGYTDIEISDCRFYNCLLGPVALDPSVQGNSRLKFLRNVFNACDNYTTPDGACLHIGDVVADRGTGGCNFDVEVNDNIFILTSVNAYACETWSCTNVTFRGNIVDSSAAAGRFGLSDANSINADFSGNVFDGLVWGIETGGIACFNVHIHDNTFQNCGDGVVIDNATSSTITNMVIENNTFDGTGLSSYNTSQATGSILAADNTVTWLNLVIANNNFYNQEWVQALINIQGSTSSELSHIAIKDNLAIGSTSNSAIAFVNSVIAAQNTIIKGNEWIRTASIASSAWQGIDGYGGVFMHPNGAPSGSQWILEDNIINMQGALDSGAYLTGTGNEQSASATYGLVICRNTFIGTFSSAGAVRVQTTTTDSRIYDNDVYGVLSAASTWYALSAGLSARALPVLPCSVANLPAYNALPVGTRGVVTDATSPTFNGSLTGGGSAVIPVINNTSGWVAG